MRRWLRFHTAQATVLAGVALVLGGLALATRQGLHDAYGAEVDAIFLSIDRTAQQLATRTAEVFDQVSRSTLVVDHVQSYTPAPTLATLALAGVIDRGVADPMFTTDVAGFVLDTTVASHTQYVADEDFFKLHRTTSGRDVHIGPVWTDAVTGTARVPVTRRMEVKGRFHGIVGAMVDPVRLTVPYGRHEASGTVIGVLGDDGVYRSRATDGHFTFGERIDPARIAHLIDTARRTREPGRSSVDGVLRFAAMVKVERYPLHAVVAVNADDALLPYRHARARALRWALGAGLFVLLAGAMSLRLARSLDDSRARASRAEASFRAALDGSLDAVFILDAVRHPGTGALVDLHVRDCNDRAAAGLGTTRTKLLNTSFCDRLPSVRNRYFKAFECVMATRQPADDEYQATDPGLEGLWLHHQIVPLDDGVALISRDITRRKADEAALAELGRRDSLTGLANRRAFEEKLDEAIRRSARAQDRAPGTTPLALLYLDLDGFKSMNDSFGHAAGDLVLREVAHRLQATVRASDVVARLGGDEFAVIAENAGTADDIGALCERLLASLSKPHLLAGEARVSTPSIGVALHLAREDGAELRHRADAAMYRAKQAGKARFAWAPPTSLSPPHPAGNALPGDGTSIDVAATSDDADRRAA